MIDFDAILEKILQVFLIIYLGIVLAIIIGITISLFKREIIGPNEYTKQLEQSLNEQIQEKEVYRRMLEESKNEN